MFCVGKEEKGRKMIEGIEGCYSSFSEIKWCGLYTDSLLMRLASFGSALGDRSWILAVGSYLISLGVYMLPTRSL